MRYQTCQKVYSVFVNIFLTDAIMFLIALFMLPVYLATDNDTLGNVIAILSVISCFSAIMTGIIAILFKIFFDDNF